jgi:hypothetical protein
MSYNFLRNYTLTLTYPRTEVYGLPLYYDVNYREQMWTWKNVTVMFCGCYLSCVDMFVGLAVCNDRTCCTQN